MVDEFTKGSSLFVSLHACKYSSSEEREGKRKTIRSEQDRKKTGEKEEEKYWKGVEGEVFSICLPMSGFIWTPFHLFLSPKTTVRSFKK